MRCLQMRRRKQPRVMSHSKVLVSSIMCQSQGNNGREIKQQSSSLLQLPAPKGRREGTTSSSRSSFVEGFEESRARK